jgi:hypothetical protein
MMDDSVSSNAHRLKNFIEELDGFEIIPPPREIPYGMMGATICEAILQAGVKYDTVVKPRIEKLRKDYGPITTTSGFLRLINEVGVNALIDWKDNEKPSRIRRITEFFVQEGIETEAELKGWLENEENIIKLKMHRGIGDKTADYFKWLVGIPTTAVDLHIMNFLRLAGIHPKNYYEAKSIVHHTADIKGLDRRVLDHSIWKFMSTGKRGKVRGKVRGCKEMKGDKSIILPHKGDVIMKNSFDSAWDYLDKEGPLVLQTRKGTEFKVSAVRSREGKPVIRFFQHDKEYARAYECCWGHYCNCNRTRIGMYCEALDSELGGG